MATSRRTARERALATSQENAGPAADRLRETFGLRLPAAGRPLMHQQAMRLQCGGLAALRETLGVADRDVHRLVASAHERHASFMDLPWQPLVAAIAAWTPRKRTGR